MAARFLPLDQSDPVEIAGYSLRARLGAGGMGSVYLSFTRGGRPIAIKVVRKEFADDPEFRRRFRQEITVAQRVQGLYTAPVLDADPDAPIPWLATAYIAGPSLNQGVTEHGPFPMLPVFRLLGGVAEGLSAIHGAGLVHRDLKPANVMLAEDGPRVIDFGIAYAADATTLTTSGAVMGTPAYMAPEQVSGRPVSAATDVFALAHLVVYAATGHTAFGDGHMSALVYRIAHEPPNLDGCPDSLRDIAQRCLAKNPEERPDLAEVMAFSRQMLSGRTMQIVGASWLPAPVAETLVAYGTSAVPPQQPLQPPATLGVMPAGQAAATRQDAPGARPAPGAQPAPGAPGMPSGGYQATDASGGLAAPVTMPVTALGSTPPPARRRRGLRRPAIAVPAAIALLAVIALGAYLAGHLSGNNAAANTIPPTASTLKATASASLAATASPTASASAATQSPAASASPAATASASGAPSATASAPAGLPPASSTTYSTSEPFPLCDPTTWLLTNLTVEGTNGCTVNMQVTNSSGGYGFGTASKFSTGLALAANNTTTFTGALAGSTGGNECMGVAEGTTAIGYFGYLCDNGTWFIKNLIGLGTSGVVAGKQVATGSFPYTASASYDVSLRFQSGKATLTISLAQGAVNSITQTFSTGQFTPTAVGYGFVLDQDYGDYPTVSGFAYATN